MWGKQPSVDPPYGTQEKGRGRYPHIAKGEAESGGVQPEKGGAPRRGEGIPIPECEGEGPQRPGRGEAVGGPEGGSRVKERPSKEMPGGGGGVRTGGWGMARTAVRGTERRTV